jgi:hypothetical protein
MVADYHGTAPTGRTAHRTQVAASASVGATLAARMAG